MDGKRTPELSDEDLDRVAGGLSMGSSLPGTTYSTSGPAAAGPGAGPSDSGFTVGGGDPISTRLPAVNADIYTQLLIAGTLELYERDFCEYRKQHTEWQERVSATNKFKAGPEPVLPNPYDYL